METTHTPRQDAKVVSIHTQQASWGIFCFTPEGDLFLNSDWGMYGYAWRSFGPEKFHEFLAQCNPEYIVQKFDNNYYSSAGKKIPKFIQPNLVILVQELINYAKTLP